MRRCNYTSMEAQCGRREQMADKWAQGRVYAVIWCSNCQHSATLSLFLR